MTKQADYGIVLMTRMAGEAGRQFTAGELAEETQLPAPTVSKILKILTRQELLDSHRGVKGGYSLARDTAAITMAEIIGALDGPIAITECIDDSPGECVQEPSCAVRANWQRINDAIRLALENVTLAEMVHPLPQRLVTLGGRPSPIAADRLAAGAAGAEALR
ncbi:MAG: SUF system Fe-S cluster assembly regulator [Acidobacteriota bacterium]|nr:SUF system Fe-S cluster assembly regulator [Acidobacteriota bacterium]